MVSMKQHKPDGQRVQLSGADYNSYVDYFIVFATNIGFHDADWRRSFGGTTYLTSGSHGCINMPTANAKALFDVVAKGTPVVAYYREYTPVYLHNYAYSYVKPEETANE